MTRFYDSVISFLDILFGLHWKNCLICHFCSVYHHTLHLSGGAMLVSVCTSYVEGGVLTW